MDQIERCGYCEFDFDQDTSMYTVYHLYLDNFHSFLSIKFECKCIWYSNDMDQIQKASAEVVSSILIRIHVYGLFSGKRKSAT